MVILGGKFKRMLYANIDLYANFIISRLRGRKKCQWKKTTSLNSKSILIVSNQLGRYKDMSENY